ncbi:DUF4439 domain-containing protein [Cellulomonas sp.]|uniref:DUF4439 domain-containing protein n=1 Tax=Cellulomonas sp. TaxID=40001 RepID=UPI00258FA0D3|nr:DUF4439 domain-containing protein [Cellulomonas sp.]MCR6689656.1 DUF4439 domain-containing protein [Cellulomonas sp.]
MTTPDAARSTRTDVAGVTSARLGAALLAALVALVLAGCGLRPETPPPVEPSPDAVEQVRGRTAADALEIADAATSAAAGADVDDELRALLEQVAQVADQHAEQLGGTYDSGLPRPGVTPTSAGAAVLATPADVLAMLGEAADEALRDADALEDGALARLVGSIAVSRADLGARLADALEVDSPAPVPADEQTVPETVAQETAAPLARAHDEAGFAFEVVAAHLAGKQRAAAREAAQHARTLGTAWATAAGIADGPQDPRLAAYALPVGLDDDAVLDQLERTVLGGVADAYAAALAREPAGGRAAYLDGLLRAVTDARAAGAAAAAFPGLPEQAEAAAS